MKLTGVKFEERCEIYSLQLFTRNADGMPSGNGHWHTRESFYNLSAMLKSFINERRWAAIADFYVSCRIERFQC